VIPPAFDEVFPFSDGLALVHRDGRAGFIDRRGTIIIAPTFRAAWPFSDGLATVMVGGEDLAGGRPAQIDRAGHLVSRLMPNERFVVGGTYTEGLVGAMFLNERAWGYVDRDGSVVIPPRFVSAGAFHGGLAPATIREERTDVEDPLSALKCGYIDRAGRWVVPPRYGSCDPLQDGVAMATPDVPRGEVVEISGTVEGRWDYIDTSGRVLGRLECAH
jgi:hypothetical protein